ncbi:MAG: helix-turn-helix domain-containing protein [Candidatus Dormibacteraceae bacterium]
MTLTDTRNPDQMTLAEAPDVVKVEELRKVLRIGRNQAYALINSGELWSCRIGGAIRIPKAAIEDFLADSSACKAEIGESS